MKQKNQRRTHHVLVQLGDAVRARRLDCLLSQQELATKANMHRTYITEIENGMRNATLLTVLRIAEALGLTLSELFAQMRDEPLDGNDGTEMSFDGDGQ